MAIVFEQTNNNSTRIAVWEISENEEELLNLLPPLENKEEKFLQNISNASRRKEWLASRVLIYQLTGLYPAIGYNESGQPYLINSCDNLTISHTKGYAAIGLSQKTIPGIDIEYPSDRIRKVSDRFLNTAEQQFIQEQYFDIQLGLIWCAKEAVYKAAGHPGISFKEQIIVSPFIPHNSQGSFVATFHSQNQTQPFSLNYHLTKDYYLVWTK
ncbi:4'-phosphopantetheinyl transferase family protein [Thermophagus xiamenensis]|uniref:Phosphopantetheinyl transferase n=1 Tax=Thermophagus xiamenensis TaxID=385682 RepID=A0A1I1YW09_9BACT|nr:4'-phosphopantetheinyl transferase superfamily protein [Thermophagus xiamenensis]SFE23785.1 Phosphopantetheinyl transferase [Thermophagus xiamenensis]